MKPIEVYGYLYDAVLKQRLQKHAYLSMFPPLPRTGCAVMHPTQEYRRTGYSHIPNPPEPLSFSPCGRRWRHPARGHLGMTSGKFMAASEVSPGLRLCKCLHQNRASDSPRMRGLGMPRHDNYPGKFGIRPQSFRVAGHTPALQAGRPGETSGTPQGEHTHLSSAEPLRAAA